MPGSTETEEKRTETCERSLVLDLVMAILPLWLISLSLSNSLFSCYFSYKTLFH